jgi:alkylhydroperoxidase family enzyme
MLGVGDGPPEEFFSCGDYYGALLNSPPMCATLAQLGTLVRTAGERSNTYSHADREFVDQVLSAEFNSTVVQEFHLPDAIAAGVRIEAIEALRAGDDDALTPEEQLLARYIRQVVRGDVQDETWNTMLERLGQRGLVEYTVFITFLQLIMRLMQALQTAAPSQAQIDEQIARLKADRSLVPDIKDHLH